MTKSELKEKLEFNQDRLSDLQSKNKNMVKSDRIRLNQVIENVKWIIRRTKAQIEELNDAS